MKKLDDEVEARIDEYFEDNYRHFLAQGGAHVLTQRALDQAKQQVQHYWRKMRDVAINVTDTEVRLQLPNQVTPKGRRFVIEGVVDLVREQDRVRMYDIKTHYCDEVKAKLGSYQAQLNLYAYVWKELRGQEVHEMGVIAIQLPERLRAAIRGNDPAQIEQAFEAWNPLVSIDFTQGSINGIFDEIARTVDAIEDRSFAPRSVADLQARHGKDAYTGRDVVFATLHCRNCDGRFSCDSYREYVQTGGSKTRRLDLFKFLEEVAEDPDGEDWIDGNLGALDDQ